MNTKRIGRLLALAGVGVAFIGYMGGWEAVLVAALGILLMEYII